MPFTPTKMHAGVTVTDTILFQLFFEGINAEGVSVWRLCVHQVLTCTLEKTCRFALFTDAVCRCCLGAGTAAGLRALGLPCNSMGKSMYGGFC